MRKRKKMRMWKKNKDHTVVGDYINIMKTTFGFNFNLHQAFKQHKYTKTWKRREAVNKKASS